MVSSQYVYIVISLEVFLGVDLTASMVLFGAKQRKKKWFWTIEVCEGNELWSDHLIGPKVTYLT